MTTIDTLTDDQIVALGRDSAAAGDILMAAICARATHDPYDLFALETDERARVDAMTIAEARRECLRVIQDAEAQ